MKRLYIKLTEGLIGTKLIVGFVLILVYIIALPIAGASLSDFAIYAVFTIVAVLLSGYGMYRLLRLDKFFNHLAIGFSFFLGSALLMLLFMLDSSLGLSRLSLLLLSPFVISAVVAIKKEGRYRVAATPQNAFLLLFIGGIMSVVAFAVVMKNAHPASVGQNVLSNDLMWHVGNAGSFLLSIPPLDLRVVGVEFSYHYLNELFVASISYFTGLPVYDILALFNQSLLMPVLILSLFGLGRIVYKGDILRTNIFTLSIFSFTCLSLSGVLFTGGSLFANSMITAVITNINAVGLALVYLCIFCVAVYAMSEKHGRFISVSAVLILSLTLVTFSKSPIAGIAVAALCAAAIARIFQCKFRFKELTVAALCAGLFLLLYFEFFSHGAKTSLSLDLMTTVSQSYFGNFLPQNINNDSLTIFQVGVIILFALLQFFCLSPFVVSVFILSCFKGVVKFKKLDLFTLFCFAVGIGGTLAFFIYAQQGASQVYFLYAALFCMHIIAVREFDFVKKSPFNIFCYAMLGLSLVTTIFLYINLVGSGFRQFLYHYDIIDKYDYKVVVRAEDELAGHFLNENMKEEELFLTNRINGDAPQISAVYSCFSGRSAYLEGYKYTAQFFSDTPGFPDVAEMHRTADAVFHPDTEIEWIKELAAEYNIKYIVYSSQEVGSVEHLHEFDVVFQDGTVTIFEV